MFVHLSIYKTFWLHQKDGRVTDPNDHITGKKNAIDENRTIFAFQSSTP